VNFRDRELRHTQQHGSLQMCSFLVEKCKVVRGKRAPAPNAELVTVVNRRLHSLRVDGLPEDPLPVNECDGDLTLTICEVRPAGILGGAMADPALGYLRPDKP
jgi:hypothetical protein